MKRILIQKLLRNAYFNVSINVKGNIQIDAIHRQEIQNIEIKLPQSSDYLESYSYEIFNPIQDYSHSI